MAKLPPFTVDRLKVQLKLAISRLVHLQKKLTAQSLAARREIAELLQAGKSDQAMTKVRYIVRDDFLVEAMEFVQSFCDDLLKSANLIANSKVCDEFIMEQAKSVIYASDRLDVPELASIRDLLESKFGKEIIPEKEVGVYPRLVVKLSMSNPDPTICEQYLEAIAANFGIELHPSSASEEEEAEAESQSEASVGEKTPSVEPTPAPKRAPTLTTTTASPSTPIKTSHLPMDYSNQQKTSKGVPDFEELTRRFEELRSRKP